MSRVHTLFDQKTLPDQKALPPSPSFSSSLGRALDEDLIKSNEDLMKRNEELERFRAQILAKEQSLKPYTASAESLARYKEEAKIMQTIEEALQKLAERELLFGEVEVQLSNKVGARTPEKTRTQVKEHKVQTGYNIQQSFAYMRRAREQHVQAARKSNLVQKQDVSLRISGSAETALQATGVPKAGLSRYLDLQATED